MYSGNLSVRSLKDWLQYGISALEDSKIRDAKTDAWILLEYTAHISRSYYFMNMNEPLDTETAEKYSELIRRRTLHIPVQYLTGEAWFYGRCFYVNESVLIPRQDTEILVEETLKRGGPGMKILDLCTGSGCILLTVLKETDAEGVGSDISPDALAVAQRNSELLGVRAHFVRSDLFQEIVGGYDMILSNPPYIQSNVIPSLDPEVRDHEPHLALDGSEDGLLLYRRIIREAPSYLNPAGWLCMEIGYDQGDAVRALLSENGNYTNIEIVRDLSGLDRVACARLKGE